MSPGFRVRDPSAARTYDVYMTTCLFLCSIGSTQATVWSKFSCVLRKYSVMHLLMSFFAMQLLDVLLLQLLPSVRLFAPNTCMIVPLDWSSSVPFFWCVYSLLQQPPGPYPRPLARSPPRCCHRRSSREWQPGCRAHFVQRQRLVRHCAGQRCCRQHGLPLHLT